MRARLVSPDGAPPIDLVKDLTLVGRNEDCDVRLDHKSVSKLHCIIVKTDGLLLLRDLGSTNSTRVNGQRVRRAALLPNDQLTIASYKFRVQFGNDIAAAPSQPNEYTQQLDAKEVVDLLQKAKAGKEDAAVEEDSVEIPQPMQPNPLPDVYPEEKPKGK